MGDGETTKGFFQKHKPHGQCSITYANGGSYEGEMNEGKKHNFGKKLI